MFSHLIRLIQPDDGVLVCDCGGGTVVRFPSLDPQCYIANTKFLNRILPRTWLSRCNPLSSSKSFAQALVSNWLLVSLSLLTGSRREMRFDSG